MTTGGVHSSALIAGDVAAVQGEIGAFSLIGVDGEGPPPRIGADVRIRSHAVIYRGVVLGARFACGHHVTIRSGTRVGEDVSIGTNSVVEHDVTIGPRVRVHSRCFIPELTVIEEDAWLGPGVILTNARYPNRPTTKSELQGVLIQRGAVIGAGVTILPGLVIGRDSLIGAGAVVVRDVPPGTTVMGNPARPGGQTT